MQPSRKDDYFEAGQPVHRTSYCAFLDVLGFSERIALTGIIDSVTEPRIAGSQAEFSVDFGSAPVAAFDELVALLGSSLRSLGSYTLAAPAI